MSHFLFDRHQALLESATELIKMKRSPRVLPEHQESLSYDNHLTARGRAGFESYLNRAFPIQQAGTIGTVGSEVSPYGIALGITYPDADLNNLFKAIENASVDWANAGPQAWCGVCLEILRHLNERRHEIAHAIMHTTGQPYMVVVRLGGIYALNRGLEAIAYAWAEANKNLSHTLPRKFDTLSQAADVKGHGCHIIPRGIGLVIACRTCPTWSSYPGIFANMATGNAVVVKPHPNAILPLAITVQVAREVLNEMGFDPNVVTLVAHDMGKEKAIQLASRRELRQIDFSGRKAVGNWLKKYISWVDVYTEKSGLNQILIDSTDDLKAMAKDIAYHLMLFSGQLCTTPQRIFIPRDGF